jgi:hypothetical protein
MTQVGSGVVDDQLNVPLEDYELLAEVELTTNLIIAASQSETMLPQGEVDRLLGVDERDRLRGVIPAQTSRHES